MELLFYKTHGFLSLLGLLAGLVVPGAGLAQDRDSEAPSQHLSTDPAPPVPDLVLSVDPIAMALGDWSARGQVAVSPSHAFFATPGYRNGAYSRGISLEVGYHLFVLGGGLDGPFIGPALGLAVDPRMGEVHLRGALEAGWQLIVGALALSLAGGIEVHHSPDQSGGAQLLPRLSLHVGYAIR